MTFESHNCKIIIKPAYIQTEENIVTEKSHLDKTITEELAHLMMKALDHIAKKSCWELSKKNELKGELIYQFISDMTSEVWSSLFDELREKKEEIE